MSIATLKRKTINGGNSRLNPISGNSKQGFVLYGSLRKNYFINDINLISNNQNINKCMNNNCVNDNSIVKETVKNFKGMINSRNRRLIRSNSNLTCIKPVVYILNSGFNIQHSQGQHINTINQLCLESFKENKNIISDNTNNNILTCENKCLPTTLIPPNGNVNLPKSRRRYNRNIITKDILIAMPQGQYLNHFILARNCLPIKINNESNTHKPNENVCL